MPAEGITERDYSQRRACRLVGIDPKTWRYASRRPAEEAARLRLRELAAERRRFGYRRVQILLNREGMAMNHKKLFRLYREEGLSVRRRGGRKRAMGTRSPMTLPDQPNQRWSLDFVSDALNNGRRFRVLTVVDDYTRECLALVVDTSLSGERLSRELDRIGEHRGWPLMIVSDNVLYYERKSVVRQTISVASLGSLGSARQHKNQAASTARGMVLYHSKHEVLGMFMQGPNRP